MADEFLGVFRTARPAPGAREFLVALAADPTLPANWLAAAADLASVFPSEPVAETTAYPAQHVREKHPGL